MQYLKTNNELLLYLDFEKLLQIKWKITIPTKKLAKYINRKLSEKRNPKDYYAYEKVSNTEQDKSEMAFHVYHTGKS